MAEKIADLMTPELRDSSEWRARLEYYLTCLDAQALEYLHAKFPGADGEAFFTDSQGRRHGHVIDVEEVCEAAKVDGACSRCGEKCLLPEKVRISGSWPVVLLKSAREGVSYLDVRRACGLRCTNPAVNGEFSRLFAKSGLMESQRHMTFENYKAVSGVNAAKIQAWKAAREGSCLILSGSAGTGKTHLAAAIAIYSMSQGRAAYFRLVSELIDELRRANTDNSGSYYDLMMGYKEVPCLVLDDMGKERTTQAGLDYVYQIVDHRYRRELQTILTTNARDSVELGRWGDPEYIVPMVSRLRGQGAWVSMGSAGDYRQGRGVKCNA